MAETVTRAVFEAEERGVVETTSKLNALRGAAGGTSAAVDGFARSTTTAAEDIRGVEQRLDTLQKRLQGAPAAWKRYEQSMRTANDGLAAGKLNGEQFAATVREIQHELQRVVAPRLDMSAANSGLASLLANTQKVTTETRAAAREMLQMVQARQVADSEAARGQEMLARETARYAAEVDGLRAKYDPAYASASRLNQEVEELARLEREGIQIAGGYELALQGVVEKYDATAAAARRSAEAQSAFIRQARQDQDIAGQRTIATDNQSAFVRHLGLERAPSGSAREAASLFEAQAVAAARLRDELNPLGAAYDRLESQLASYRTMRAADLITEDELAMATQRSRQAFDDTATSLKPVAGAIKLTSFQVTNLGYQLNDVATMLAMGASPFAIISSQAGQVVQALGDGPGGVKGSLAAIGSTIGGFVSGLGPAGAAIGALAVGAGAFALIVREDVKPLEDVIKAQAEAVRDLRNAYGLAGDAAEDYVRRSPQAVRLSVQDAFKESRERALREISDRETFQFSGRANNRYEDPRVYGPMIEAFRQLRKSAEDGVPAFDAFESALASIPETDLTKHAQEVIEANREWAAGLLDLQANIASGAAAMDSAAVRAERLGAAYRTAFEGLSSYVPDLRTEAERINDLFVDAAENAQNMGELGRAIEASRRAMAANTAGAQAELDREVAASIVVGLEQEAAAIAQVNIQYNALERQYAGNAEALLVLNEARAQAISNIGAQTTFDLEAEAAKEAEEGAKKAAAELERFQDATRSRIAGIEQTVAAQRLDNELIGQSEGAAAALRFQFQALAAARQAAADAGAVVSPEELAAIETAAGEIATLTDQYEALREAQERAKRVSETIADLDFENSLFGLSEADREIATTLRDLEVSYESMDGQRIAGAVQYNAALQETQDGLERQRALVENVASTFLDIFTDTSSDDFFSRVIKGLADIGRQFAEVGKQSLMDRLFGGALNYTGGQPATGQRSVATPGFSAGLPVPYGAPANDNAAISVRAVSALNDNLQKSSRSALDVARQFNGLNEKANTGALDSFLQASGNWKGLSAADTAWCAAFANASIMQSGGKGTGSNLASSFMGWGTGTNAPKVGDIVVLKPQSRGASGHVGFVAGFGDGTVQVFGGNQSNGANTRSFGLDQVRGYRTDASAISPRALTKAVSDGNIDATRRLATGAVPTMGGSASFGAIMSPQAGAALANGWSGFGPMPGAASSGGGGTFGQGGGLSGLLQSPFGQGAMNAFGAFGAGVQGGPMSGALTGGLGAIGMGLGPLGIAAGVGAGLLGSLAKNLFNKKEREAAHQQAAKEWANVQPQWKAYQESLNGAGPRSGLRAYQDQMMAEQMKFQEIGGAAWKRGTGNSSEHFNEVGLKLFNEHLPRGRQRFASSFEPARQDMLAGRGLEGPFIQAQEAIIAAGEKLLMFVDDAKFVFGDTSNEAAQAIEAARAQALATLDIIQPMSQIQTEVATFEGAASSLRGVLVDLGMTADEASIQIDGKLAAAMERLGTDLTQSLTDSINELDGKGYLAEFRALVEGTAQQMRDISENSLNVDTSLVSTFFAKRAQALVDGSQLAGEAFDALIVAFPQLAGVVNAFTETVEAASDIHAAAAEKMERALAFEAEAKADLRAAYQREASEIEAVIERHKRYQETIRSFLTDMRLGDTSPLSGNDKFLGAQKAFRDTQALALGGDEDAQGRLVDVSQNYLDAARDYYASSDRYFASFEEVENVLKSADVKAGLQISASQMQLDQLKAQVTALISIDEGVASVAEAIKALAEAQKFLADATGGLNGVRDWGDNPERNRALVDALSKAGLNYTGNFGGGGHAAWVDGLAPAQQAIANAIAISLNSMLRPAPVAAGFSAGGYTGGSSPIEVRGPVHGMEYVFDAMSTRRIGVSNLDAMRTGRLPQMAAPAMPRMTMPSGNDNGATLAELRVLRDEVRALRQTTAQGAMAVAGKVEEGNGLSRAQASALKRKAAA